jgi:hypothetical protein
MTTTAKRRSLLTAGLFFAVGFYLPFLVLSVTLPNPAWFTVLGSVALAIGIFFSWRLRTAFPWLALAVAVGWAGAISATSLAICNTAGILITHICMS